jgi:hypothetical protein
LLTSAQNKGRAKTLAAAGLKQSDKEIHSTIATLTLEFQNTLITPQKIFT